EENLLSLINFSKNIFSLALKNSYWEKEYSFDGIKSINECFIFLQDICLELNRDFTKNLIAQIFNAEGNHIPYNGALCLFNGFLYEILKGIRALPFIPKGPVFLMIDDADNLNETQTRILNTWVSLRTSKILRFKISIQFK